MPEATCTVAECERPSHIRGWCKPHYSRWQLHGDPTAGRPDRPAEPTRHRSKRICSIPECGRFVSARGWCTRHYVRWKRHGDPNAGQPLRVPRDTDRLPTATPEHPV